VGERQSQRHGNEFHSHPGAYWSGVYYVDDGGTADNPSLGGELEFMDPRGPLPLMNAPHLRMTGNMTAGANERVTPKAGQLAMFPAWLMHQVRFPTRSSALKRNSGALDTIKASPIVYSGVRPA